LADRSERFTGNFRCRSFRHVVLGVPGHVADAGVVRHVAQPVKGAHLHEKRGFFGWFNRGFAASTTKYQGWVAQWLKRPPRSFVLYAVIVGVMALMYFRLPSSFLPEEDQGFFMTSIQLPVGATAERTTEVLKQVEAFYRQQPEVESFMSVAGFSFSGNGQKWRPASPGSRTGASVPGPTFGAKRRGPRQSGVLSDQGRHDLCPRARRHYGVEHAVGV
jgi:hypothetical protein